MREDELLAFIKREYAEMQKRWSDGVIFYRLKFFLKHYAYSSWIRFEKIQDILCAVLALSRAGIPITMPSVAYVVKNRRSEQEIYQKLMYLASYNIIEPISHLRSETGRYVRGFKLTPQFIESVYTKIVDQEKRMEQKSIVNVES